MLKQILVLASLLVVACSAGSQDGVGGDEAPLSPAPYFDGDPQNHAEFAVDVSFWETPLAQSQMDCFWDSGVRHVIVGTQQADIAQQQLAMAVSRGMTVDAYVYMYWNQDIATQVNDAFAIASGFPIGSMWLDIEQDPGTLGSKTLIADIQAALTACQAHGVSCGIYTSPGFWKTYVSDTNVFDNVPLWYALYNNKTSLSNWSTEAFGGWTAPVGKQFATKPLCDVGGADWDVMQVSATPTVIVDRTLPPDSGQPPPAPGNLYPVDGQVIAYDYVKAMSATIPRATEYQLAVERWTGSTFVTYYTFTNPNAYVKFYPATPNSIYRFRARAYDTYGWGAWSSYATFEYGKYTGTWPTTTNTPPPPSSSTPPPPPPSSTSTSNPPPPPPPGVPGNLSPPDGSTITTSSVTLGCSAVTSATSYQFAIESQSGTSYVPYYTYTTSKTSQTFYPQTKGIEYRWRARAMVGSVWGSWSSYASFHY